LLNIETQKNSNQKFVSTTQLKVKIKGKVVPVLN